MAKSNEYRATHDEKNGVLKELAKLEAQWQQESDKALQEASEKLAEGTKTSPKLEAVLKKYQDAVAAQAEAQAEAEALDVTICASGYAEDRTYFMRPSGKAEQALRQEFRDKLSLRLQRLSAMRSQINLANLRSEVANLDKAARKL